jgi:hypothetical protein
VRPSAPAPQKPSTKLVTESLPSLEEPVPEQPAASTSGRVVLEKADELKSTWGQRAIVGGASMLFAGVLANGLVDVHDGSTAAVAVAAVLSAYLTAGAAANDPTCGTHPAPVCC